MGAPFVQSMHGRTARLPELMRFSSKPFPIIGVVHAGTIILSLPLLQTLLLGPLRKLAQQEILGNYKWLVGTKLFTHEKLISCATVCIFLHFN